MLVRGRAEQQRRRVHGAAGDDHERALYANGLASPLHLDSGSLPARWIGDDPKRQRVGPDFDVRRCERGFDATHLSVALRVDLARERVAGAAEHAAPLFARPDQTERQAGWVQSLAPQPLDDLRHAR